MKNTKTSKIKVQNKLEIPTLQIKTSYDICIIGGGASGMTAAIIAAENNPNASICILEKKERLGKKLLATGNGRCNITNNKCEDFDLTEKFLYKHGILIKEEAEGRMYPKSEQATSVLELLELQIKRLGIHVITEATVVSVLKNVSKPFMLIIQHSGVERKTSCNNLLVASGGKAAPQFGTTGDGYSFARKLGHEVVKVAPVLMPICCENIEKELKGVRAKASVSLLKKGQPFMAPVQEIGEVQFTEEGLSGICVFNLSRYLKLNEQEFAKAKGSFEDAFRQYTIEIDFVPEMNKQELKELLRWRQKAMAGLPAMTILLSLVNTALADIIIKKVMEEKEAAESTVDSVSEMQINELIDVLKGSSYTVIGGKGWKSAQCTSGGVSLQEINMETLESKLVSGLYFAGEVMDYDGPCGGYNLQHAWVTGIKAGMSMTAAVT